jgi:hypothetical protein
MGRRRRPLDRTLAGASPFGLAMASHSAAVVALYASIPVAFFSFM